jgi:hypothetical protein
MHVTLNIRMCVFTPIHSHRYTHTDRFRHRHTCNTNTHTRKHTLARIYSPAKSKLKLGEGSEHPCVFLMVHTSPCTCAL